MGDKRKKESKVPNLRFPGFETEWEKKELGEVSEKINSGKTPLGGETTYRNKGVLFIRSQNVNNDRLDVENPVFISEEINAGMKNSIVRANDILLNITGASLGRSCVVPNGFEIGNVNQHVCIIRLKKGYNSKFIQPIFSSEKGQAIFESLQTGSGREGLNFESIKHIALYFPTSPEQQRIADFLSLINERIETQNKIIEELKLLKSTLVDHLFTSNGKKVYRRFAGFSKEWQKRQLFEVCTFFSGGTPNTSQKNYYKGPIPFIRSGEINSTSTELFISEDGLKNSSAKMIEKGNLLVALYGATSGDVAISKMIGAINQAVLCIKTNQNENFLKFAWERNAKKTLLTYLQGGQGNLSSEIIKQLSFYFPERVEQDKIACFLGLLEERIKVEVDILNLYQKQKRCLMKQMLI